MGPKHRRVGFHEALVHLSLDVRDRARRVRHEHSRRAVLRSDVLVVVVYMPGGNQGMLVACIYGVISDSRVDSPSPEETLASMALRTMPMVIGDSAGAIHLQQCSSSSRTAQNKEIGESTAVL